MFSLAENERRTLLEVARKAVQLAIEQRRRLEVAPLPGRLGEPAGAFVTLRRVGRLRGCIGQLEPVEPLVRVVAHCAMAAAVEDPRFAPVSLIELSSLAIEVSVLSRLETIAHDQVEVGRHGLVISQGLRRGVLLPQVAAEFDWTRERFLEETCLKGGLDADAWRIPGTHIQAFTAEVFSEAEPALEREKRAS